MFYKAFIEDTILVPPKPSKLSDRDAIVLVFDVNNVDSFKAVESLFNYLSESNIFPLSLPSVILVGNKIDREEDRR